MVVERIKRYWSITRLVGLFLQIYSSLFRRKLSVKLSSFLAAHTKTPVVPPEEVKNIVVVGAAFAGYFAARILATELPRNGRYRVVVVEPNTHFNFTWVLPRFCVLEGHEDKAFIPYTPDFFAHAYAAKGAVSWVRDKVETVKRESIVLRSGDEIPYEYLIIATGSTVRNGLPSRIGAETRDEGVKLMRAVQARIKAAKTIVVAGGGAAGVEIATDAKNQYPEKEITLVHSRQAVMHRFGPGLQTGAMDALKRLGVEVVLGDKVLTGSIIDGESVTLSGGRTIPCDYFINCTGTQPSSGLIADLAPDTISPTGHIKVKPTLQIDDDSLPNVYICGDVADTDAPNPNSRIAARQAEIAADNVVLAAKGKKPSNTYKTQWGYGVIKLTLGFVSTLS
ncbi:hypothetical protein B0T17DRAFT_484583 [Bombardia bombarda]|uniref:FAD/NAD(P)-binding domain-containing protein n=1 Tax=Bombardia bombarda TaxID=252184 RepID=A0AA39XHW3_9PEZI|nr:hypothetical protein B0T17DRAFT_484583 [Bombardia bombarda]